MEKIKRNPRLIIILIILFITGVAFAQKFVSFGVSTFGSRALADDEEESDHKGEKDDDGDDEDNEDNEDNEDEDKNDNENENNDDDEDKGKEHEDDDEDDDKDEAENNKDESRDDEDESGEELKDISELITKVEKKISQIEDQGGSIAEFNKALDDVKDLVAQAQARLAEGKKSEAENLIEQADDKLENLEESVKLVLGERDDDDEEEFEEDDQDKPKIAREYKNVVAQFVHDLKELMEIEGVDGGIGAQVQSVAQIQNASQERVVEVLDKIEDRSSFKKFLFGPDLRDLDKINEEIVKNQAVVKILTQISEQSSDVNVKLVLQRQIQLINQENLKLQNYVDSVENVPSMFGWITRITRLFGRA